MLDSKQIINEEALRRLLQEQKISRPIFRLPMSREQAIVVLRNAYMVEVAHRGRTFTYDDATRTNIEALADALTTEKPKQGIMLAGNVGNGKTTLMQALKATIKIAKMQGWFEYGEQWGLRIADARDIAKLIANDLKEYDAIRRTALLAIDDMGKEPAEVLDYGNAYNPVIELMEYRYNEQLFTIISTNLTPKQVREKYGNRIADRFNEMMCVIAFTHDTYRK